MSLGNDISKAVILKLDQNHEESLLKHRSLYLMHRASESVAVGAPWEFAFKTGYWCCLPRNHRESLSQSNLQGFSFSHLFPPNWGRRSEKGEVGLSPPALWILLLAARFYSRLHLGWEGCLWLEKEVQVYDARQTKPLLPRLKPCSLNSFVSKEGDAGIPVPLALVSSFRCFQTLKEKNGGVLYGHLIKPAILCRLFWHEQEKKKSTWYYVWGLKQYERERNYNIHSGSIVNRDKLSAQRVV